MMQARLVAMEEGKEPSLPIRSSQPRFLPMRLLQFFLLFLGFGIAFTILTMFMSRHFRFENVFIPVTSSRIQPCFQEPNDFRSWIKPPLNVWHLMNDSQLFWRATFDPQIKSYPFKRVPKLAFMFLTRGPLPMAPLWERFFKGHEDQYSIYVHALPMYNESYPPSSAFYRRQIPSQVLTNSKFLISVTSLNVSYDWYIKFWCGIFGAFLSTPALLVWVVPNNLISCTRNTCVNSNEVTIFLELHPLHVNFVVNIYVVSQDGTGELWAGFNCSPLVCISVYQLSRQSNFKVNFSPSPRQRVAFHQSFVIWSTIPLLIEAQWNHNIIG